MCVSEFQCTVDKTGQAIAFERRQSRRRRQVLTVRPIRLRHIQFTKSKIAQRNMSIIIQQYILRFQIAIDDMERMQMFQCAEQFSSVEAGAGLAESTFVL